MKYLFFKSKKGNFGDDLNPWLWPKIFGNNIQSKNTYFLGIGSILHNENHNLNGIKEAKKIVFGTGVRPSQFYTNLTLDKNWDVKFLRGPLSAAAVDNKYEYITDAAYVLRQLSDFDQYLNCEKKYEISLMPYFHSVDYFDWENICKTLGYHYISPFSESGVEDTLREIAASKVLITEAMHGAIVADLLRVPWHRYILSTPHTEGGRVSDFKWTDWLNSVGIYNPEVTYIPFYEPTRYTRWIKKLSLDYVHAVFLQKSRVKKIILERLRPAKKTYVSKDEIISEIDNKLAEKIIELKHELSLQVGAKMI